MSWLNPAWSSLPGLPLNDLLGHPPADLARPSETPRIRAAFDGLVHDGTALPFAATLTGSDGWPRSLVFHL